MQILIIDLGSQYTSLIGRRLRNLGVRSFILPPEKVRAWLRQNTPKGVILSGGAASVYEGNAPEPPEEILHLGVPVLGICLGMQWLAEACGGKVEPRPSDKEYGAAELEILVKEDPLFRDVAPRGTVWTSHGDSVTGLPSGFSRIARTKSCEVAAMTSPKKLIWGVQFHPEVEDSEYGETMLRNFCDRCGVVPDWSPHDLLQKIRNEVKESLSSGARCLRAFSGGVDSTTLAAVLSSALHERLYCVLLDAGHLREGELDEIHANAAHAGVTLHVIDGKERFLKRFGRDALDAEEKRQRFQAEYRSVLEEFAEEHRITVLLQGTLAPDIIESANVGKAERIKTHHNVGFLSPLTQLHPFRELFKYEVRDLARSLGLPVSITDRMPFPGPGLFCRIVGLPVTDENLLLVRWADARVRDIVRGSGLESAISQLVVVLLGVRIVGVKGDHRSYEYPIAVRAVKTSDFMTCRGYQFPPEIRRKIQQELEKHPRISCVLFDESHKPPRTVEFE